MAEMIIKGALSKGNSNQIIYFCEYQKSDIEKRIIQKLLDDMAFKGKIYGDSIETLAIESNDGLQSDMKLVGLIFASEEGKHKSIVLDNYEILESCFEELIDDED